MKLHIFVQNTKAGQIFLDKDNDVLKLEYDHDWQKKGFAFSPALPLNEARQGVAVSRFLENLLPEGQALEDLLETLKVSRRNILGIIKVLGGETTGALTFLPQERNEYKTSFKELPEKELAHRLDLRSREGLISWNGKVRLSVAGVQDKLPVTLLPDGRMGFGEGNLASTHILKFQRQDKKLPHLVLNEIFCMKLAKKVGLNVANVDYHKVGTHPVLVVERFDRRFIGAEQVERKHIIDSCQLLNLPVAYKYEKNFGSGQDVSHIRDGVSLKKLFAALQVCKNPALASLSLLDWTLFNLIVSNRDAHGKNVSFLVDKSGISLAPFYDIVNTSIYPEIDEEMSMAVGDEFSSEEIFAFQLAQFCEECGIQKRLLENRLIKICKAVELSLKDIPLLAKTTEKAEIFQKKWIKSVQEKVVHYQACVKDIVKI